MDSAVSDHRVPKNKNISPHTKRGLRYCESGKHKCFLNYGIWRHLYTDKYRVHINIKKCATNSRFVFELGFCTYARQNGYSHFIGKFNLKLTKGSLVVSWGKLCCSLYLCEGQLNVVKNDASPYL